MAARCGVGAAGGKRSAAIAGVHKLSSILILTPHCGLSDRAASLQRGPAEPTWTMASRCHDRRCLARQACRSHCRKQLFDPDQHFCCDTNCLWPCNFCRSASACWPIDSSSIQQRLHRISERVASTGSPAVVRPAAPPLHGGYLQGAVVRCVAVAPARTLKRPISCSVVHPS